MVVVFFNYSFTFLKTKEAIIQWIPSDSSQEAACSFSVTCKLNSHRQAGRPTDRRTDERTDRLTDENLRKTNMFEE